MEVSEKLSPVVYVVKTNDQRVWKRHIDQLKSCNISLKDDMVKDSVNIGKPEPMCVTDESNFQSTVDDSENNCSSANISNLTMVKFAQSEVTFLIIF